MNQYGRMCARAAWAAALALGAAGCGGTSSSGATATGSTSALAVALASTSAATGTLLCAPTSSQVDACTGVAVGDPCVLTSTDDGTVDGVCRVTLDGTTVGCAPKPPALPEALVTACSGKVAGDACQAAEPFGDTHAGVCVATPDATLVCGRVRTPQAGAIAACDGAAVGDSCALPDPAPAASTSSSKAVGTTGVCSLGPVGTGPLACSPAQSLLPHGEEVCAGLAAGATCTLGRGHDAVTGTCQTPEEGGTTVCVVACGDLGGPFHHRGPGMDPDVDGSARPPMDPGHVGSMDPMPIGTRMPLRPPAHR